MVARHDKYYFEDGNVIMQVSSRSVNITLVLPCLIVWVKVGDKLFRVHKRLLVGSETSAFVSMFSMPYSQEIEGQQTDEKPIILRASQKQFEALMRVLYQS